MNTLSRTTRDNVYVLNAPAFAAALTRSKGFASANLQSRLTAALDRISDERVVELKFSRSPKSGRWYVYVERAAVQG